MTNKQKEQRKRTIVSKIKLQFPYNVTALNIEISGLMSFPYAMVF